MVIVKSNLIKIDVRVPKIIESLSRAGHAILFLSWNRDCEAHDRSPKGYGERQLMLKAPWGGKVLPFLPMWWFFVFFWLMTTKWDAAHAINFDSAVPTIIAGKLKRRVTIYEILDTYEDHMPLPKILRTACVKVDKLFVRLANAVIIVDEMQEEELEGIPNSKVVTIYDSPREISSNVISKHRKEDVFTLYYGGALYKVRKLNLDKCFEAIKNVADARVVIAGYGDQVEDIKRWACEMPDKIKFLGLISHEEALRKSAEADLMFQLRDPTVPVNKFICGCTLFETMMSSKPLLVNKGSSTAIKVSREKCGLVVDASNIEEIQKAITKLKDSPDLVQTLGANGREAYEKRYSWKIMERRLVGLYDELFNKTEKDH